MKHYEYFLLDWDGNLAKTLDIWLEAERAVLAKRNLHPSDEEIGTSFGASKEFFTAWGIADVEEAINEMDNLAKLKLPEVSLYPDTLEVLEGLWDANKKLALITSSTHENVEHLLEKHNLAHYFSVLVAADDVQHHKTQPEALEKALTLLGGTKDKAVMIGDSDKDLVAAHNAGVDSILFYPDAHRKYYDLAKLQALNPTYTIRDFRTVLDAVSD